MSDSRALGRLACCAPHCRRTKRHDPDPISVDGVSVDFCAEWICANHWRRVPPATRRLYALAKRRLRKFQDLKHARIAARLWRRCVREAIERAAGI